MDIVVIDDDKLVRKGIQLSIDWASYGLRFVGEAANGQLGLELCHRTKPQIAIVDIMMPLMDGLELTRALRECMPELKVVILSGHSDFEYARAAIRLGVRNYLLKPAKPDELAGVIAGLRDDILAERSAATTGQAGALAEHLDLIRAHYLSELLSGRSKQDEASLTRYASVGLRFDGGDYLPVLIDILDYSGIAPDRAGERLKDMQSLVADAFADVFETGYRPNAFWNDENRLCAVLNLSVSGENAREAILALGERFTELALRRAGVGVRMAVGDEVSALDALATSHARLARSGQYSAVVAEAMQYVEDYFQQEIKVSVVASHVHVTPNHFSRLFARETGMHFIDYLNKCRVRHAKRLLVAGGLRTSEVAERCGYADYKYFGYIFNKYVGCSPTHYLERLGSEPAGGAEP